MVVCRLASGCKEMDGVEVVGDIEISELGRRGRVRRWQVLVLGSASVYIGQG